MDRAKVGATERRLREHARAACDPGSEAVRDTGAAIDCLCRLAVTELGLLGAAVTLMTPTAPSPGAAVAPAPPAYSQAVAGASDERAHELEHLQFSLGEGPSAHAFTTGRPVLVPDLEAAFARWPAFAPAGLRAGLGAVHTFPLQLGAVRFGTLTLYDGRSRSLSSDEVTTCLILAEIGTERLLESAADGTSHALDPGLDLALRFRSEVYQAQGKVAVQLGVSLAHALLLMRARAYASDQDLSDLAIAILDETIEMGRHVD
ncbi:GAF domain-containing protein [Nocardioides rubriscoriae]|uniref:GAF domain-containing protein n=1 Tax=Nocardioides rubriscoriae TaxID=642762 RepID=UPI0011DFFA02|nr:GAF domain-containing protein [Nocardioides rubriscoriae]